MERMLTTAVAATYLATVIFLLTVHNSIRARLCTKHEKGHDSDIMAFLVILWFGCEYVFINDQSRLSHIYSTYVL